MSVDEKIIFMAAANAVRSRFGECPSDASALRMIGALLAETTKEWQSREIAPAQNGS